MSTIADIAPRLEARTTAFVKEHRLPGAAVGVVRGEELVVVGRNRICES